MKLLSVLLTQNTRSPLFLLVSSSKSPGCEVSNCCYYSTYKHKRSIKECYRILKLPEGSSADEVRDSYRTLAKKYHPDSGATTANAAMFMQIDDAYRDVLTHLATESKKAKDLEDEEEKMSEYKVPQHRQYLSYEGVGFGTPSQRQRQYMQFRVDRATDQVLDYRKQKLECQYAENSMIAKDVKHSKKVKITQAIERLVEDLIQESMAKGDFDNLSGKGKPLNKFSSCPHIDPMTHNLNRILIDNGYQPEWIILQKEIRETIDKLREGLVASRKKLGDPMTYRQENQWTEICETFRRDITKLNKRINDFNLVVPLLSRQMVHFNVEKEISRAEQAFITLNEELKAANNTEAGEQMDNHPVNPTEVFLNWIKQLKNFRNLNKHNKD
ncbi:dnaJ homolog subfamily C member 28 [Bufo bufo]|uniref:dnaJ homolog subfamily C member 28 n=1 Tax=Bufo bufo TaxID=8384 RepID=UPI001ABE7811|nr:dnaJ homolog subfamily C member 28 [Bufo bufo]XP_040279092.1 dnaJ homolog subfamily C member 28 [Bufo bufo]XP_040279093.1 dnaJ homolog subfamily C member 28 [Bufo bufo]